MKPLCYLLLTGAALAAPDGKYSQIIYQVEYDATGNQVRDATMVVEKGGKTTALEEVLFRSEFDLYVRNNETDEETHIQRQTVKAYAPSASTLIETIDPYVYPDGSRRTLIGQPFTVTHTVGGLVTNDPNAQDAAKMIEKSVGVDTLADNSLELADDNIPESTPTPVEKNGTSYTTKDEIPSSSDNNVVTFGFDTLDDIGSASYTIGTPAKLYRFKEATGSLSGIESNTSYKRLPDLKLKIQNAYPQSLNYIRIIREDTGESYDLNIGSWFNSEQYPQAHEWDAKGPDLQDHPALAPGTICIQQRSKTEDPPMDIPIDEIKDVDIEELTYRVKGTFTTAE